MHEPYVADPAEPPTRPRLARLRPAVATVAALLLLAALATLYWTGRGEEDPSLRAPDAGAQREDWTNSAAFAELP